MHTLLARQIKRYLGEAEISPELQRFLQAIDSSYQQADADRGMLERSLELTSQELQDAHTSMRAVFAQLVNSSAEGIFAFDREYRFVVWNPDMERISGIRTIQVIGKSVFTIFPALRETREDRQLAGALAGHASTLEHHRSFIASEHGWRGFECFISPLRNEADQIIGGQL